MMDGGMAVISRGIAREIVLEEWLPVCQLESEAPVVLVDEATEEHEWGWVFYVQPSPGDLPVEDGSHECSAFIVDRETGISLPVSTAGLRVSVARLLELRARRSSPD
jgi:hypothetical protein